MSSVDGFPLMVESKFYASGSSRLILLLSKKLYKQKCFGKGFNDYQTVKPMHCPVMLYVGFVHNFNVTNPHKQNYHTIHIKLLLAEEMIKSPLKLSVFLCLSFFFSTHFKTRTTLSTWPSCRNCPPPLV